MNTVQFTDQNHVLSDLLQLEACRPLGGAPHIPLAASAIVTPLIPHQWEIELLSYIVSGLTNGFHIGYRRGGSTLTLARSNMMSALQNPSPVQQYLASELAEGRIAGPFKEQVSQVHVNRFGVILKSSKPGEWRLILDLSFPPNLSVNGDCAQCVIRRWTRQ